MPGATVFASLSTSRGPLSGFVAVGLVWGAFVACLPDLKVALGVSEGQLGRLLVFSSAAAILQMAIAPWLAERLGRAALPLGVAAMGLAVMLPAQAGQAMAFAGAMALFVVATGVADIFMNARLSTIEGRTRARLMNLNHASYSFAYGGAAAFAGLLRGLGFPPELILALAGLATLALAVLTLERDGWIDGLKGVERAFRGGAPLAAIAGAIIAVAFFAENAVEAWSALYLERDLGALVGAGAAGPAVLGLTMGMGRLFGQAMVQRFPELAVLFGGLGVAALGAVGVALAPGPWLATAAFAVIGLGVSVVAPTALGYAGRVSPSETRGRVVARAAVIGYLGFFLGPPGLELVAELVGLRASFVAVAMVLFAALFIVRSLARAGGSHAF